MATIPIEAKEDISELQQAQTVACHHVLSIYGIMSLKCALELGIPDIIHNHGRPVTLSRLVSALSVHPNKTEFVCRLMRLLVQLGYFTKQNSPGDGEEEEAYLPTALSSMMLKESTTSFSPFLIGCLHPCAFTALNMLSNWFKEDEPTAFHMAYGKSVWDYAGEHPEFNNSFNEAMVSDSSMSMDIIVGMCGDVFQGLSSLVDVGGGTGLSARAIAKAFPGLKCTVLDLPHVVAAAPVTTNVDFVGGSMFDYIPPADAIFLKWILHDWSDDDCVKILKRCKEAIPSKEDGGKVIIVDTVVNTKNSASKLIEVQLFLDMAMMVNFRGKEREEREWQKIFFDAGFKGYKIKHALGIRSLIEIYP